MSIEMRYSGHDLFTLTFLSFYHFETTDIKSLIFESSKQNLGIDCVPSLDASAIIPDIRIVFVPKFTLLFGLLEKLSPLLLNSIHPYNAVFLSISRKLFIRILINSYMCKVTLILMFTKLEKFLLVDLTK